MSSLITCDKVGKALTEWLHNASDSEKALLCDALECGGGANAIASVVVKDSQTVGLQGDGTQAAPLTGHAKVAPSTSSTNNLLTATGDGLLVDENQITDLINNATPSGDWYPRTGGTVEGDVKIKPAAGQASITLESADGALAFTLRTVDSVSPSLRGLQLVDSAGNVILYYNANAKKIEFKVPVEA